MECEDCARELVVNSKSMAVSLCLDSQLSSTTQVNGPLLSEFAACGHNCSPKPDALSSAVCHRCSRPLCAVRVYWLILSMADMVNGSETQLALGHCNHMSCQDRSQGASKSRYSTNNWILKRCHKVFLHLMSSERLIPEKGKVRKGAVQRSQ